MHQQRHLPTLKKPGPQSVCLVPAVSAYRAALEPTDQGEKRLGGPEDDLELGEDEEYEEYEEEEEEEEVIPDPAPEVPSLPSAEPVDLRAWMVCFIL